MGGATPIDALDQMCKDYLNKRACLKLDAGGSCAAGYYGQHYIHETGVANPCGKAAADGQCATDVCVTNAYYINEIATTFAGFSQFDASGSTCAQPEKTCSGAAPMQYASFVEVKNTMKPIKNIT